MNLQREETTGTLKLAGVPLLGGLYAENAEQRVAWLNRVPAWLRWACGIEWYVTWTTPEEARDAIGRAHRKTPNAGNERAPPLGAPLDWLG
jgi:hypothetical protein